MSEELKATVEKLINHEDIPDLGLSVSSTYSPLDTQHTVDKVDAILALLRSAGILKE